MSAIGRKKARDLLSDLVARLCNPPQGYERYKGLYDASPTPRRPGRDVVTIRDLLYTSMRPEVFEMFSTPNLKPKAATIWEKGGDITKPQRGVYLHMIEGLDGTWRFYVGQAENMSYRIRKQHSNFRWRRDNPSLHNYALQNSRWDHFIILAVLPPGPTAAGFSQPEQALLLNMLEMWCALLFCTLQPSTMAQWHEHGAAAGARKPWVGLNLACPLDHGGAVRYVNWRHPLSESEDPLAKAYVAEVLDKKRELTPERGMVVFGLMMAAVVAVVIATSTAGGGRGRGR